MPGLSQKEKKIKLKALRVALILLEKYGQRIDPQTVLKKANEIGCPKYFSKPISEATIKAPKTEEFKNIVNKIKNKKNTIAKFSKSKNTYLNSRLKNLKEKVENLTFITAQLLDENYNQDLLIKEQEQSLELLREEREFLLKKLRK